MVGQLLRVQSCGDRHVGDGSTQRDDVEEGSVLAIEEQPDEHAEQEDDVLDEDGEVAVAF